MKRILKIALAAMLGSLLVSPAYPSESLKGKKSITVAGSNKKLIQQALDKYANPTDSNTPFECSKDVTSVSLSCSNASLPNDFPYIVTFGESDILVQVYNESGTLTASKSVDYPGDTGFNTVKKYIKEATLVKLKNPEGDLLSGAGTIEMNVYEGLQTVFTAFDKSGEQNVSGSFLALSGKLLKLIPNLSELVEKAKENPYGSDTLGVDLIETVHYWE